MNASTTELPRRHTESAPRWIIATKEGGTSIIEVTDCIREDGDFGWVAPVDPTEHLGHTGVIANFKQLFPTRAAAIAAWCIQLREKIANHTTELERWMADPEAPQAATSLPVQEATSDHDVRPTPAPKTEPSE
jgi:hypothetical protein